MGIKLRISNKSHHHNESFSVCVNNTYRFFLESLTVFQIQPSHPVPLLHAKIVWDIAVDVTSVVCVLFVQRVYPYVKSVNTAKEEQRTVRKNVDPERRKQLAENVSNNALKI